MNVLETKVIEGTPFTAIKKDDEKFMIALGNQLVSELEFDTIIHCENYCAEKPWDLLTTTILILCNHLMKTKELEKEIDEKIEKEREFSEDIKNLLEE